MKRTGLTLCCLAAALTMGALMTWGAERDPKPRKPTPEQRREASIWMTRKLEYSKSILDGLTRGDFDLVRKNAEAMQVVGYLEMWDRADLPEYRRQIRYFDTATKELIRQAGAKNINGATLAYTQLTLSCVQCHTVVRDTRPR